MIIVYSRAKQAWMAYLACLERKDHLYVMSSLSYHLSDDVGISFRAILGKMELQVPLVHLVLRYATNYVYSQVVQ